MTGTGPVAICRTSELAEAGAFWTIDVAHVPLLVTRDAQGALRAFVNVCRHRGVRLVREKHGVTKSFTCLLHGWTYGADGQMGGTPLARLARDNPMLATIRENNALTPLAFELRHGFVWLAPRPREAVDVATHLGDADAALAARGVESFVVHTRSEVPLATSDAGGLAAAVRPTLAGGDRVHTLSDDTLLVFHPHAVSLFTLVRRRAEMDFCEELPATCALDHVLLAPEGSIRAPQSENP